MTAFLCIRLSGSEDTVTSVTKTRKNVILFIQPFIEGCEIDVHVWMLLLNGLNTLWRCYQAHKSD